MTTQRFVRMPDGEVVAVPEPVQPPEREEQGDDLSDIAEVTNEDIMGVGLDNSVDDLVEVTEEDVMGEPDEEEEEGIDDLFGVPEPESEERRPRPETSRLRRTTKQFPPRPTRLGEMKQ